MRRDRLRLAPQKAEKFLKDQGIDGLPIDPIKIAESLDIVVQPKPDTAEGVSGMLLRQGESYGILYATHIDNVGFQNFCIAHELGHFLLEGHFEHIFPQGDGMHESRAGFVSADPYELEADHFAAGLLMPDPMFSRALVRMGDGLEAIEAMADLCRTSMTATAIRYAEKTSVPVAVVMSTGERIDYCFMSTSLQDFEDLEWPWKGQPLPGAVETDRFNRDPENVLRAERAVAETDLRDWFGGRRSLEATEEVLGLGRYGKTLTVITSSAFADDEEEDDDLDESWTPRFRR